MKINKKMEAFTLSEMVVVLILTSVVVGLAFSVLSLVQKHMLVIQTNFNNKTELNKLEQSLWLDFNQFSNIEYDDYEEELRFKNDLDSTSYKIQETYIIRESDTFNIRFQNREFFFDGNKTAKGIIDAVKLETTKDFQNQPLFIFKENDAKNFMD